MHFVLTCDLHRDLILALELDCVALLCVIVLVTGKIKYKISFTHKSTS